MQSKDVTDELMKLLGISDKKIANRVIKYANNIKSRPGLYLNISSYEANDLSLARELGYTAERIIDLFFEYDTSEVDISKINKLYVILVNELKNIYRELPFDLQHPHNSPKWMSFDHLENFADQTTSRAYRFLYFDKKQRLHNADLNALCIINNVDTPIMNSKLKDLLDCIDREIKDLESKAAIIVEDPPHRNWFIPEYYIEYSEAGVISMNSVYIIKKTNAGSASTKIMEQIMNNPNSIFKPNLGKYSRTLSTTLSSIGFSGTIRKIFLKVVSEDKGVIFRPNVSRETVDSEGINTEELDEELKKLGAMTENKYPYF